MAVDKDRYARLILNHNYGFTLEEWQFIASQKSNIEVEVNEGTGEFFVYGYLTYDQYRTQLMRPDALWIVPGTSLAGDWDDEYYEQQFEE